MLFRSNLKAGKTIWLLGLESAAAPDLRCRTVGQRGTLRLEHCVGVGQGRLQEHAAPP